MSIRSAVYLRLENWYADGEWNIWHLPFGLILKHTHDRSPFLEASNIAFVRKNTFIPVPHILDVIPSLPSYPGGLIIMKNIEGVTLHGRLRTRISYPPEFYHYLNILENGEDINIDELRAILDGFEPTADLSDSVALLDDLRRALLELRAIPPPPSGQVSGAYGAPFISMRCSDRVVLQPFESIRAFHDMLLQSCAFRSRMPRLLKLAVPVYAKEHRLCFTHSDLHTRNILIKDGRLAGIVDWETAGWFPEY